MTSALLPLLALLLVGEAPPGSVKPEEAAKPAGKPIPLPPPPVLSAPPAAAKPVGQSIPLPPPPVLHAPSKRVEKSIPLPPPPVLAPHAAAKPVGQSIPLPPPPVLHAGSAEDLAAGELLLEQKCAKCHDVAWAFAADLSDAQWRGHMKRMNSRPGAAITDAQAKQIQRALQSRRARSAAR